MLIDTFQKRAFLTDSWIVRFWEVADILSSVIPSSEDVTMDHRPHGFVGTVCSKRQIEDAPPSVAAKVILIASNRWSCSTCPFIGGILDMHQKVAPGGEMGIRSPSPGALSITSVHQLAGEHIFWTWLHGYVDKGGGKPLYQSFGDEGSSVSLEWFHHMITGESVILLSDNAAVIAFIKRQGGMVSWVMCNLAWDRETS